ncbi:uncharacterized protein LOC124891836 [Capsicum annuum]|uniref:uncharacterized protein LOC124891836 n=1 Tax=Capsicum annuum TaxID=4072 RepID=UPI001FB08319|nr:uncharacterized protein LOC124891836 [Capsicum annuum]
MDDTSTKYDFMGCDEWDNSEDYEEEECGRGQTFQERKTLKLLLKQASVKISLNYTTLKSSKKYLRVRCIDHTCRWIVRACAIEESGWFHVQKYVGEHTCGIVHVTEKHKNVTMEVITSLIFNFFVNNKGPSPKEIERIVFRELHCRPSYWNGLNPRFINSFMVNEEAGRFIYYFMAFGASIRGYAHMRKVVAIDGTHLSGKYKGMLLFVVAQDTQNHIYPLAYYVMDKENDAS